MAESVCLLETFVRATEITQQVRHNHEQNFKLTVMFVQVKFEKCAPTTSPL